MNVFSTKFDYSTDSSPVVAVKDSINIAGYTASLGCQALANGEKATQHATVIQQILDAGGQIAGKTVMHELAFGMTGINHWQGTPENPHYPQLIPGGSSSGSAAAVAAGLVDFALGTDTGGSIRLPAACCGVYGIKPTFGRVSRQGVYPQQSSLDCVGPLSQTAEQLTAAMKILLTDYQTPPPLTKLKLGWVNTQTDDAINHTVQAVLQKNTIAYYALDLPLLSAAYTAGMTIINSETWQAFGQYVASDQVGEDVAIRLQQAGKTTAVEVAQAERIRQQFTAAVDQALSDVTALVLPTLPHFPLPIAEALAGKTDLTISALVRPFNLSGHPALTIPCQSACGQPVGIQLVGKQGDDELLCAIAEYIKPSLSHALAKYKT